MLTFDAKIIQIKDWKILRLPRSVSKELPSRGMVVVKAMVGASVFIVPLEPDGEGSHWFKLSSELEAQIQETEGMLSIESTDDWPEPEVPTDLFEAIDHAGLGSFWESITTKARWEWVRWVRSTANPETRERRIAVACSKMADGEKRPCCYDHSRCMEPYVAKGGKLNRSGD